MKKVVITIVLAYGMLISSPAQIRLDWIDTTSQTDYSSMYFFTNRPVIYTDSGWVSFADKYQYGTDTLTFGTYFFKNDSFAIKFRVSHGDKFILDVPREKNFLYKIYENLAMTAKFGKRINL